MGGSARVEPISHDVEILGRAVCKPNFKWRLRNLNGRKLLESAELVEAVRAVLDLSTIKKASRLRSCRGVLSGRHERAGEIAPRAPSTAVPAGRGRHAHLRVAV